MFYFFFFYSLNITNQLFQLSLWTSFKAGFFSIFFFFLFFFFDSLLIDDEPLFEPLEWSLTQTWIFFFFIFAWIAENLISARFGSYSGKDKRVWCAWYKAFWWISILYILSFGLAILFVITPFYFELTYSMAFIFSWWHIFNKFFFFSFFQFTLLLTFFFALLQLGLRWLNYSKLVFIILISFFCLSFFLFWIIIISHFSWFSDPYWYTQTRFIDEIQLSHEPLKWGWGTLPRDHFTYHDVTTIFWSKNDKPLISVLLFYYFFIFLILIWIFLMWVAFIYRIYVFKEIPFSMLTYAISFVRQFMFLFFFLYILIFFSFILLFWRYPIEFLFDLNMWFL